MRVIILPGNSLKNKNWAQDLSKNLSQIKNIKSVYIQEYLHWESGEDIIDLKTEVNKLTETIKDWQDYIVIAKSVGTLVVAEAVRTAHLKPKGTVFLGLPVEWAKNHNFDIENIFKGMSIPVSVIQNKEDPITSADNALKFIRKMSLKNIDFTETSGDTHDYNDFKVIIQVINKFI